MTIKRILLPLPGPAAFSDETDWGMRETDLAMSVTKALGAHVVALFINPPPPSAPSELTDGDMFPYRGSLALSARDPVVEERERLAREARERFALSCAANVIPLLEANEEPDALPAASWREREGLYATVAARQASAFDLIIAASAAVTKSLKDIAEQSLLQGRRPVLLAPSCLDTKLTDPAMIAWDDTPECWHAVSAAIPLLKLAQSVRVVSVDKNPASRRASHVEVLSYLRSHDLRAAAEVIAPDSQSVGDSLLANAAELAAGLLVMGAYSHNRLREMLLGGVTRYILQHASCPPVLLAH
jgi:nucleotide-binding universal stress UspA family protein